MSSEISFEALEQKPFVLWVQKLDRVFEGWSRQDCIDQMLKALRAT